MQQQRQIQGSFAALRMTTYLVEEDSVARLGRRASNDNFWQHSGRLPPSSFIGTYQLRMSTEVDECIGLLSSAQSLEEALS
jgi:hypothetical protein